MTNVLMTAAEGALVAVFIVLSWRAWERRHMARFYLYCFNVGLNAGLILVKALGLAP